METLGVMYFSVFLLCILRKILLWVSTLLTKALHGIYVLRLYFGLQYFFCHRTANHSTFGLLHTSRVNKWNPFIHSGLLLDYLLPWSNFKLSSGILFTPVHPTFPFADRAEITQWSRSSVFWFYDGSTFLSLDLGVDSCFVTGCWDHALASHWLVECHCGLWLATYW